MRYLRRNQKTGQSLEKSSLCEFVGFPARYTVLTRLSNYSTKYRPELDLVLKDINVTAVCLMFPETLLLLMRRCVGRKGKDRYLRADGEREIFILTHVVPYSRGH